MFRKRTSPISPASALALIALFVALSGVSYAAGKIGTNAIKNGAVTAKKLHRFAVTPGKIRNGAVNRRKLRKNSVTGHKVVEATLGKVPSAANADHAGEADSATNAQNADTATDAEQLGGVPAVQFGSGILGAAVTAPPAPALAPSGAVGSPIGSGDFQMPVSVPMQVRNLTVQATGDLSRPFVASLRNPGEQALTCGGVGTCTVPGPVSFEPGDVLELAVTVVPGPAAFTGATYQVGYRITP